MKNIKLFILMIIILIFTSCVSNETSVPISDNYDKSENYHLQKTSTNSALLMNTITNNSNGAYQILTHWNNTGIITYFDFNTMSKIPLSSDISTAYTSDSTAYLDSVLGGVIPIASDNNLFVIKQGSKHLIDTTNIEDGSAKIIKMNLSGGNKKELIIPSNIVFAPNSCFILDNSNRLYTITYNISENIDEYSICLTRYDIDKNLVETIYTFETEKKNIILMGAYDNTLFFQCRINEYDNITTELEILSLDIENMLLSSVAIIDNKNSDVIFTDDAIYYTNKQELTLNKISFNTCVPEIISTNDFFGVADLYEFHDNRIIASSNDNSVYQYYSIDINGNIYPLSHFYEMNGGMKFMGIYGETENYFVVPVEDIVVDYEMKNSQGNMYRIQMPILNYALIEKNDYWNNIPNYKYFSDYVDYTAIPN